MCPSRWQCCRRSHWWRRASVPASACGTCVSAFSSCGGASTRGLATAALALVALIVRRIRAGPRRRTRRGARDRPRRRVSSMALDARPRVRSRRSTTSRPTRRIRPRSLRSSRCAPAPRCRRPTPAPKRPQSSKAPIRTSGRSSSPMPPDAGICARARRRKELRLGDRRRRRRERAHRGDGDDTLVRFSRRRRDPRDADAERQPDRRPLAVARRQRRSRRQRQADTRVSRQALGLRRSAPNLHLADTSPMRDNPVKTTLAAGGSAFGAMIFEFFSPGMPQICRNAGAEFVLYDMEHTGPRLRDAEDAVRALPRSAASCRWCACRAASTTSSPARSTSARWA